MKNLCSVLLMSMLLTNVSYAEQTLVFSQIKDTPDQMVGEKILKAAYRKLGIEIKVITMPGKRALKESSEGRLDGEVHRVFNIGKAYPTLVRVPTSINYIEPVVFSRDIRFKVTTCAALKGYIIGIVGGIKHAEICTKGMPEVRIFGYSTKMLEMLSLGKIDIAITAKFNGLLLANRMKLSNIAPLKPALSKKIVYHYLHEKNGNLVSKINTVFLAMKKSGELAKIREDAIKQLFDAQL